MVEAFAISDPGLVRRANEDSYVCNDELKLYAVADGLGGHSAGEVASRLATEALEEFIARAQDPARAAWPYGFDPGLTFDMNRLRTAVRLANHRVFSTAGSRDDWAGMGTTVTAILISGAMLSYAHVGDSRLYLMREGRLTQLTRDDSWIATVLAHEPAIKSSDLAHHPLRHVLTNAVGAREEVDVQVADASLSPGTVVLLSSDGLHGMTDDETMGGILRETGSLPELAERLVRAANERGGHDNITAVLVRFAG
jgi:protein phosphatase